jgi:hypothetical protein
MGNGSAEPQRSGSDARSGRRWLVLMVGALALAALFVPVSAERAAARPPPPSGRTDRRAGYGICS